MVTVRCRQCCPLAWILVFVFCCVLVQKHLHRVVTVEPRASVFHNDAPSNKVALDFKCTPTNSTIPSYLPKSHQEFLRYKHCRAFPTLLSPSPCEDDLYLLFVIKSTATQVERRAALRETWAKAGYIQDRRIKVVFLVGRSLGHGGYNMQPLLEWENRHHNDILQWDFADSFFNLTLKEVGFLSWFSQSCKSTHFVFKGDDDVFVNTENLIDFLRQHKPENHLFTGDIMFAAWPIRNRAIKYFVPEDMYPNKMPYPPYAGGGGYLMSRQTVLGLGAVAQTIELFPIDDVYVGMCLKKMGIRPIQHRGFLTFGFRNVFKHFDPCVYRDIMLVHKLNPGEMWAMWALIQDASLRCGKSRARL
ncbi:hypothetical protein ACEWY4_012049 [Coilia grayii]|uniref:Hexosyltransferase n=1 Tax=Coilia grayii TaxID=363190 RepID=A0ABD1JZJ6_9TELE